ncbi:MAG: hypothetical protein KJ000_29870 [Pirellulaceae bacterium]|nr:hypothetical protein [Pirellulaceae bacterium]
MARRSPNSNRPVRPSSTPAKRKGIPLSALAQQMQHDLQLAGRKESPASQGGSRAPNASQTRSRSHSSNPAASRTARMTEPGHGWKCELPSPHPAADQT